MDIAKGTNVALSLGKELAGLLPLPANRDTPFRSLLHLYDLTNADKTCDDKQKLVYSFS